MEKYIYIAIYTSNDLTDHDKCGANRKEFWENLNEYYRTFENNQFIELSKIITNKFVARKF